MQIAHYIPYGKSYSIISRGYGYVQFASSVSAQKAIDEINGTDLNGLNSGQKVMWI